MTVRESWVRARDRLARRQVSDAALEAEVLLRSAMDADRAEFFASLQDELAPRDQETVGRWVERRLAGEPLAYILGRREFYGLDFIVGPQVMVPRQETELLVELALEFANRNPDRSLTIADVGTGSGAIAVALASNLPQATVYATDTSQEALALANVNRRRHWVSNRVRLRHGDLLDALDAPVDMIVSNPPYLNSGDLGTLAVEVRQEPQQALDGGPDGLQVTRRLLEQAPAYLTPGGYLLVEIAPQQRDAVSEMARQAFDGADVSFAHDLLGLPRVIVADTSKPRRSS